MLPWWRCVPVPGQPAAKDQAAAINQVAAMDQAATT
jgi:hypothetical protein